jgi:hypothetical protein
MMSALPAVARDRVITEVDRSSDHVTQDAGRKWLEAMYRGDFEAAWRETDRIECPRRELEAAGAFVPSAHHLLWNGTPFDGRDVAVRCNHGLGDTLQFIRFVPLIARRARSVTVLVQPPLVELLSVAPALGRVLNGWAEHPLPPDVVEVEVMELAYACRATADTLPTEVCLPPDRIRARLPALAPHLASEHKRVGVLWSPSDWDTSRGVPLTALAPLRESRSVEFFSLQQGNAAAAAQDAPFPLRPLNAHTHRIADAAAAMLALDLIITVDGMAAHLAGSLGRPVWLLLKHEADWRWMRDRADSPWYPTMRLFRQHRPGDWDSIVHKVAHALAIG